MSFVIDQVRRIDGHLDRLASDRIGADQIATNSSDGIESSLRSPHDDISHTSIPRILELQHLIKRLSTTAEASRPLASAWRITDTLASAQLSHSCATCSRSEASTNDMYIVEEDGHPSYEHQLEWLLLCKATAQTYGQVLNTILEQTLVLNDHSWYWDEILNSDRWAGIYSLQTSPLRLWSFSKSVWADVRSKDAMSDGWAKFYSLVQESVRDRSIVNIQASVVSPLAQVRNEATSKQAELKRLKEVNSNALGLLLGEGLSSIEDAVYSSDTSTDSGTLIVTGRRNNVAKSIVLMESVLSQVCDQNTDVDTFEDKIGQATANDSWIISSLDSGYSTGDLRPSEVSSRLQSLLSFGLSDYKTTFSNRLVETGKPSNLVRYWIPVTVGILSSSTLLRIFVNRKAEILTWIREFGVTVRDFWTNWVVEPTRKILGTIRHDESSQVAIMSKRSLEGDRDSLERMVIDFVKEAPENGSITEAQLQDIQLKIREGDLTPILKAYEKDIQKPIMGALRGNLIRTLLIQVQKTKVDVEVAMGGIDALLKSQELVFGFVGLTPGVLVVFGVARWLNNTFIDKKGSALGRRRGRMLGVLRNIDRILTAAQPSKDGALYYKDYGLLLCETHVLRQIAGSTFPPKEFRDFLVDLEELTDMQIGLGKQQKVVSRMRWGYARWL